MPKPGVSDAQLQANLDYVCGLGIDCSAIQPGGACFEPATVAAHATHAMNLYYQNSTKNPTDCDFAQTATLSSTNPSKFLFIPTICMKVLIVKAIFLLDINIFCILMGWSYVLFVGYRGCSYPGGSS